MSTCNAQGLFGVTLCFNDAVCHCDECGTRLCAKHTNFQGIDGVVRPVCKPCKHLLKKRDAAQAQIDTSMSSKRTDAF